MGLKIGNQSKHKACSFLKSYTLKFLLTFQAPLQYQSKINQLNTLNLKHEKSKKAVQRELSRNHKTLHPNVDVKNEIISLNNWCSFLCHQIPPDSRLTCCRAVGRILMDLCLDARETRLNCVSPPGKYLRPVLNGIKSISIQLTSFPNWFLVDCSINIQLFPIFTPVHSMRSARKIVSGINQTRFVRSNYEAIVIETAATWNINFHPLPSTTFTFDSSGCSFHNRLDAFFKVKSQRKLLIVCVFWKINFIHIRGRSLITWKRLPSWLSHYIEISSIGKFSKPVREQDEGWRKFF